ncbi:MAG: allene oxide cyclase barrel-like domain-containing protein [Gaiellaceae bacterium]
MTKGGTMLCKRLILIASLVASLIATTGASALNRPEVLSVLVLPEGFTPLTTDLDVTQFKAGDSFGFVGGMYTWAGVKQGKRIGRVEGSCQFVSAVSSTGYCTASAFLPGGRILFQGHDHLGPAPATFPITGGTGRYANARGWVSIKDIGISGKTANVFHLLP